MLHQIDDAMAFVRLPRGIHKQVPVFARGKRVFVPHAGGYARVCTNLGDGWATSCPTVRILDFTPVPGLDMSREPSYHKETEA